MNQPEGTAGVRSDARPKAGRWPYACAWTLIFAVAAALALENLDGYHNEVEFSVHQYSIEPPVINWTHGWPFRAFVRLSPWRPEDGTPRPTAVASGRPVYSRWPINGTKWEHLGLWAFAADVAISGLILGGTGFMLLRWANRATRRPSYGLRTLLFYITTSAVALFFINRDVTGALEAARYASELELNRANSRFFVHAASLAAITFGGVLTIFASFEIARAALTWAYVRQKRWATGPTK